jgi:hypothetical protein
MTRWTRQLASLSLGLALALAAAPSPARAQPPQEEPAEGASEGRPWDGYIAVGLIAGLALFLVGKSARR